MTKTTQDSKPRMPAPRAGMVIEPVTTYEEVPIVTEAARAELLASLERGEDDVKAGRVKRMSGRGIESGHARGLREDHGI